MNKSEGQAERVLYQGVDFTCNSQFSPWDAKGEKLVRDDNSEPSDPNPRSTDSPLSLPPDLTQHTRVYTRTCSHAHRHAYTRSHTQVLQHHSLFWTWPSPTSLTWPLHPLAPHCSSVSPTHKTPLSCLRDPRSHLPPKLPPPQALPISLPQELQAKLLGGPCPRPRPSPQAGSPSGCPRGNRGAGRHGCSSCAHHSSKAGRIGDSVSGGKGLLWQPTCPSPLVHPLMPLCTPQLHRLLGRSTCIWDWKYLG